MEQRRQRSVELRAVSLMARGLRDLFRPPFLLMLLLDLLIFGASASVTEVDEAVLFGTLLLAVVSAYVQIAMTMAAAGDERRSADEWIKLAFKRRVFWRFVLTGMLIIAAVFLGFLALIVGGLVLGAMLALAQTASVQERAWPWEAVQSSIALSEGHRIPIGIIFAVLYLLPTVTMQIGVQFRWDRELGLGWPVAGAVATTASLAGVIALTRAYVALGGRATEIGVPSITLR
ncbi:MAG: hypothetical protein ACRDK3_15940 [Actinomycetota bacterium]